MRQGVGNEPMISVVDVFDNFVRFSLSERSRVGGLVSHGAVT